MAEGTEAQERALYRRRVFLQRTNALEDRLLGGTENTSGNRGIRSSVLDVSEEYPVTFILTAIACLLGLGFIFSRFRARKSTKPEIPKLFQ
jgi:hypothetical protein